uniref:Ribosomal protein L16 n=1 Tax=Didymium iridis TaxID=5793 RepID=D3X9W9_9MYCE|nr:ribosomal protein L16 [Didymium iridis]ADD25160.1 ribosomal protein L16 [Didymium iridis]
MKKFPNNVVYSRPHKIKTMKGTKGINLSRYTAGLRLKSSSYISYEQLEASRRVISRLVKPKEVKNKKNQKIALSAQKKLLRGSRRTKAKRKKYLLIRSNLCLPLTKKPLQVRMGKGKGSVDTWVYSAKQSRVIFEMSQQQYKLDRIKTIFHSTSIKLPTTTKFTFNRTRFRRESNFKRKNI